MWIIKNEWDADKIRHMKDYQTVISDFPQWKKAGKYISSISPKEKTIHETSRIKITASRIEDKWISSLKLQKYTLKKWKWTLPIATISESEKIIISNVDVNFVSSFLDFLKSENIGELKSWNFKNAIKLSDFNNIDVNSLKDILATWTINSGFMSTIIEYWITNKDVVALWYRKQQLEIFNKLLNDETYIKKYKEEYIKEYNIKTDVKEEKLFQYFFGKNPWIFWYWLDYRYLELLQNEATVWSPNTWGKNQELLDFLLWCKEYTVLVEIKKPSTPLFGASKNRSWARSLSHDLIDSISQILEYKASSQIFLEEGKNKFDKDWNQFNQNTIDPKVMLIIWKKTQMKWNTDNETIIKKRTFELYKRDSRNIDILTYDELYDRAKFIIESA